MGFPSRLSYSTELLPPFSFPLKHCNGFQRLSSLTLCLSSSNWVSLFVKKIWLFNMILFRFTKIVIKMLNRIAVISTSFGCVCSGMKRRKTCKMLYIHQQSSMMHWIFLSLVNIADIAQTFSPAVRRALCMVALREEKHPTLNLWEKFFGQPQDELSPGELPHVLEKHLQCSECKRTWCPCGAFQSEPGWSF